MKIFFPQEQNAAWVFSNGVTLIVVTPGWLVLGSLLIRLEPVSYKVSSVITWSTRSLSHVFTHSSWSIMSTRHLLSSCSLFLASILKTLSLKLRESLSFAISYMNLLMSHFLHESSVLCMSFLDSVMANSVPKGDMFIQYSQRGRAPRDFRWL